MLISIAIDHDFGIDDGGGDECENGGGDGEDGRQWLR